MMEDNTLTMGVPVQRNPLIIDEPETPTFFHPSRRNTKVVVDDVELEKLPTKVSTAEEYMRACEKLDALRCHLGEPLSPAAEELYGPTVFPSKPMKLLWRWGSLTGKKNKPDKKERYEAKAKLCILGEQWPAVFSFTSILVVFTTLYTVATLQLAHWSFILVAWLLASLVFALSMSSSLSNPAVVPRRLGRGIMAPWPVRVALPVPNAKELGAAQQEKIDLDDSMATAMMSNTTFFDNKTKTLIDGDSKIRREALKKDGVAEIELRYCTTCKIYRSPRGHHCSFCDCCVDVCDHHCVWIGTDVGQSNYAVFFFALVSAQVYILYLVASSLWLNFKFLVDNPHASVPELLLRQYYFNLFMYLGIFLLGIFIGSLLLLHIYLLLNSLTTVEFHLGKINREPYSGINPWRHLSRLKSLKARLLEPAKPYMYSEYFRPVILAALIEEHKVDLLLSLPKEEEQRLKDMKKKE